MIEPPLNEPPSPHAIREGALALVAAGKPLDFVAGVYGMSVQSLCKLLLQAKESSPGATPPLEPAKPWHRFPGTVVYRYGMDGLVATFATALLGVAMFGAAQVFGADHTGAGRWVAACIACAVALFLAWRSAPVKRFEMRRDAIVRTTRSGRLVLRYADIVAASILPAVRGSYVGVTLFTRDGPRMHIAPSREQMADPAFRTWLDAIPRCGSVMPFTFMNFIRSPGFITVALMAVLFVVVPLGFVRHPQRAPACRQAGVADVNAASGSESSARCFSRAASAPRLPASHP